MKNTPKSMDDVFNSMAPAIIIGVDPFDGNVVVMFLAPQTAMNEMTIPQMGEQYAEFLGDVFFQLIRSANLTYEHLEKITRERVEHLLKAGTDHEVYAHESIKNFRKMN